MQVIIKILFKKILGQPISNLGHQSGLLFEFLEVHKLGIFNKKILNALVLLVFYGIVCLFYKTCKYISRLKLSQVRFAKSYAKTLSPLSAQNNLLFLFLVFTRKKILFQLFFQSENQEEIIHGPQETRCRCRKSKTTSI